MNKKLLLFLIPSICLANDEMNIKYGLGIIQSKGSQVVSVNYQKQRYYAFHDQIEIGGWLDPKDELRRSGSTFGSYSLGLKISSRGLFMESMHGIGLIQKPDVLLGGPFQFFHDIGIGIRDIKNFKLGLTFKHVSSAGLNNPNIGRNFVTLRMGLPL